MVESFSFDFLFAIFTYFQHVDWLVDQPRHQTLSSRPRKLQVYIALHSYKGRTDNEMSFSKGDHLHILRCVETEYDIQQTCLASSFFQYSLLLTMLYMDLFKATPFNEKNKNKIKIRLSATLLKLSQHRAN